MTITNIGGRRTWPWPNGMSTGGNHKVTLGEFTGQIVRDCRASWRSHSMKPVPAAVADGRAIAVSLALRSV